MTGDLQARRSTRFNGTFFFQKLFQLAFPKNTHKQHTTTLQMRYIIVRYRAWPDDDCDAPTPETLLVREVLLVLETPTLQTEQPHWGLPRCDVTLPASASSAFSASIAASFGSASSRHLIQIRDDLILVVLNISATTTAETIGDMPCETQARLQQHGAWAVDSDFVARGALPESGVLGAATLWNIPICASAREAWALACEATLPGDIEPLAVYHGTTRAALTGISARGFEASHGMLGHAVYVGTFWKAVRYASRTANYALRAPGDAVIVRAYVNVGRCVEFDGTGDPCVCATCITTRAKTAARALRQGLSPDLDRERTRVADHAGAWYNVHHFDTAHVPVVKSTGALGMYVTRNEEWAVAASKSKRLWAQGVAGLDMTSVSQPHWDPMQRNQRIM
jgi:hypothetical protein